MIKKTILTIFTILIVLLISACGKPSTLSADNDLNTSSIPTEILTDMPTATPTPIPTPTPVPFIPFETSPDLFITEETKADIEKADEMRVVYDAYYTYYMLSLSPTELVEYMETASEDEKLEFVRRAEIISELKFLYGREPEELEKYMADRIKSYLNVSMLKEEEIDFVLTDEFNEFDPVLKTHDYLMENKIMVTDIIYPEDAIELDMWNYPMKFVYTYAIKGNVNGEDFFKNITKTFYFEFDPNKEMQEYISAIQ